jgi:hypothetical protein
MYTDLYVSAAGFIFRNGATETGRAPFHTLVLEPSKKATAEEIADMNFEIGELIAGELYKTPYSKEPIVLGPAREFTHEVTLRACGNPDHGQYADIAPKKIVRVVGIEEAQKVVRDYQSHYYMGFGNCAKEHGVVWELPKGGKGKRKKVGEVSYDGRYWTVAEKAKWEAERKAKYHTV